MERRSPQTRRDGRSSQTRGIRQQTRGRFFDTLNAGIVTKDLVNLMEGVEPTAVNSEQFLKAIRANLEKRLA